MGLIVQKSLSATPLPARVAWADMDSGDSESDGDEHAGLRILTRPAREGSGSAGSTKGAEVKRAFEPGPPCDYDADSWAEEVRAMAAQLRALAKRAPQMPGPPCSATATATDATAADIDCLQAGTKVLATLHQRAADLRAEAVTAATAAEDLERRATDTSSSAQRIVVAMHGAAAVQFHEHNAALAEVAQASEVAAAAAKAATLAVSETRVAADVRHSEFQQLQTAARREAKAFAAAKSEALVATAARSCLRDAPRLERRMAAAAAVIAKAEDEHKQLQLLVTGLRTELEAAPRGRGARAEMLEPRIADLERECRELVEVSSATASADASDEPPDLESGCELPPPLPPVPPEKSEIAAAQERNRRLVAAVKDARAERDKSAAQLEVVQVSTASARRQAEADGVPFYVLEEQLRERTTSLADARREKEVHQSEVAAFERKQQLHDEMAAEFRKRHHSVEVQMRELLHRKRKDEDAAMLTEWQLQNAVAELMQLKPNNAISKCLASSKRRGGSTFLGCEAGDGTDGDASTIAGDSVAEGV